MRHTLFVLFCLLLGSGCPQSSNPAFCDEDKACVGEDGRTFCDIDGVHPASDGRTNTCIEPPVGACNRLEPCSGAEAPICSDDSDGQCVQCTESAQCDGDTPVCDTGTNACIAFSCTPGEGGDAACAGVDPSVPYCGAGDTCVACLTSEHCATPGAEVCDQEDFACRGCIAHDECGSGVCDLGTAICVPEADIIYVATTGTNSGSCGTQSSPCQTIAAAIGRVSGSRDSIVVAAGSYSDPLLFDDVAANLIGNGTVTIAPNLTAGVKAVTVSGTSTVSFDGFTIAPASGGSESYALLCDDDVDGPTLILKSSTVRDSTDIGIFADDCDLTIEKSTISGNQGIGISASGGSVSIQRSTISGNLGGGIDIGGADFDIVNNYIVNNGQADVSDFGGVTISNSNASSSQRLDFNTIARNHSRISVTTASGLICSTVTALVTKNNIIYDDTSPAEPIRSDCEIRYSLIEADASVTGSNNLTDNPMFLDTNNANYHIQPSSPAVNAADPAATLDIDFDGDSRPMGSARDIGADEAN